MGFKIKVRDHNGNKFVKIGFINKLDTEIFASEQDAQNWLNAYEQYLEIGQKESHWERSVPQGREILDTRVVLDQEANDEVSHMVEVVDEETGEIEQRKVVDIPAREKLEHTEYLIGPDYSVEIIDITEELEVEAGIQAALKAQEKGAKIIGRVWAINESKNMSPQAFGAIVNDATLQRIERLLWSGSLKTAKILIQTSPNLTDYFTQGEIDEILGMLD